jgi:CRP/FNR family transcriptional regulator, dissimilatory nitrate respiration regulator
MCITDTKLRSALLNSPMGRYVGQDICDKLLSFASQQSISADTQMFDLNDPSKGIYLVVDGKVKLTRSGPGYREHIVHLAEANAVFGEASLFLGKNPVAATAIEDASLLFFPAKQFLDTMSREYVLQKYLLGVMAGWMQKLIDKIDQLTLHDGAQRVAGYLVSLLDNSPYAEYVTTVQVELPTRKKDLATMLNMNQPSLSRILRQLQDEKLIDVRGRRVSLLDMDTLRAMSRLPRVKTELVKREDLET